MKKGDGTDYQGLGADMMTLRPDQPLLLQAESRELMLASIGSRLREVYAREALDTMPDNLRSLLQQLSQSERAGVSQRS